MRPYKKAEKGKYLVLFLIMTAGLVFAESDAWAKPAQRNQQQPFQAAPPQSDPQQQDFDKRAAAIKALIYGSSPDPAKASQEIEKLGKDIEDLWNQKVGGFGKTSFPDENARMDAYNRLMDEYAKFKAQLDQLDTLCLLCSQPLAYAPPPPVCADGNLDPGEECDPPTVNNAPKSKISLQCQIKAGQFMRRPPKDECSADCKCVAPPMDKCCICEYQEIPGCEIDRKKYITVSEAQKACKDLITPPYNLQECVWKKLDNGEGFCQGRFRQRCEKWLENQKQCDGTFLEPRSQNVPELLKGYSCKDRVHVNIGHGQGCDKLFIDLEVCLKLNPECQSIKYVHEGCSTFWNLPEARKYMERLRQRIEKDRPDLTIEIKGNQAKAGLGFCTSFYDFKITCKSVEEKAPDCKPEGDFCYDINEDSVDCIDNGRKVRQHCCISCQSGKQGWTTGACYKEVKTGYCEGTGEIAGGDVGKAMSEAAKKYGNCIVPARENCTQNGGKFIPHGISSGQQSYGYYKIYFFKTSWRCCTK